MVRRPVAWIVAVVLFAEALGFAALNWILGVVVHRQRMSLAGLDSNMMANASKAGGILVGLYFALCALVALLVAVRGRRPAGFGRVLLISAAVVHGLLAAFTKGLVGWPAFLFMIVVMGLIVLLLMTYDAQEETRDAAPGAGAGPDGPHGGGTGPVKGPGPGHGGEGAHGGPAPVVPPAEPGTP
ncbi:hypothetical protein ABZ858_21695 [Streptomyces sp. NPDC047017]|uniref:hypothetical protein n=1 Tax=Streptomyces sp. NPDC047017 TaxID=3155024 RepID=UPI0033C003DC